MAFDPATGGTRQFGTTAHLDRTPFSAAITVTQPIFRGGRTVATTRRAENQVLGQRARLLAQSSR